MFLLTDIYVLIAFEKLQSVISLIMSFRSFDSYTYLNNHHPKQAEETLVTIASSLLFHLSQFSTSEATTV